MKHSLYLFAGDLGVWMGKCENLSRVIRKSVNLEQEREMCERERSEKGRKRERERHEQTSYDWTVTIVHQIQCI